MLTLNTKLWQRVDTENDDATYLIPQNNIIIGPVSTFNV